MGSGTLLVVCSAVSLAAAYYCPPGARCEREYRLGSNTFTQPQRKHWRKNYHEANEDTVPHEVHDRNHYEHGYDGNSDDAKPFDPSDSFYRSVTLEEALVNLKEAHELIDQLTVTLNKLKVNASMTDDATTEDGNKQEGRKNKERPHSEKLTKENTTNLHAHSDAQKKDRKPHSHSHPADQKSHKMAEEICDDEEPPQRKPVNEHSYLPKSRNSKGTVDREERPTSSAPSHNWPSEERPHKEYRPGMRKRPHPSPSYRPQYNLQEPAWTSSTHVYGRDDVNRDNHWGSARRPGRTQMWRPMNQASYGDE